MQCSTSQCVVRKMRPQESLSVPRGNAHPKQLSISATYCGGERDPWHQNRSDRSVTPASIAKGV
jgi:hypothetical protein